MSIHIIVDGYNVIRRSSWLVRFDRQNIRLGRDALIKTLVAYRQCKKHEVTVVFDGMDVSCMYCQYYRVNGIEVVFSKKNQTADQLICNIVKKEKEKALVVSCDREIVTFAESCGASVIDSPHFEEKIINAIDCCGSTAIQDSGSKSKSGSNSKFITRKKGPSRRLPKNKRRQTIRIEKL